MIAVARRRPARQAAPWASEDPAVTALRALSIITAALDDDDRALGEHVGRLLLERHPRPGSVDARVLDDAGTLLAYLGKAAAFALLQWSSDTGHTPAEWVAAQTAGLSTDTTGG